MALLVVGTVGIDVIETPYAAAHDVLGGSATYFSYVASFFTRVHLVSIVGADFPEEFRELLENRGIDLSGVEVVADGKTFRWRGRYFEDMNRRETLEVHLNVMERFSPRLSDEHASVPYVFLANASPKLQLQTLDQLREPRLVVADTMDFWIQSQHDELLELLRRIDGLVLNDQEAQLLSGENHIVRAARVIQQMGPRFVVLKKGEHGALFFDGDATYVLPAFPTPDVVDPTGAGDSFAGGFMGYLAANSEAVSAQSLKQAMAYGIVAASFTVEGFSLERLVQIDRVAIEERMERFRQMVRL